VTPSFSDAWLTIYGGDCRAVLRELPAESAHCVITSPPYWGLRDYGTPGQLGLEATPEEYVAAMVDVFREVRRVLRSDGTVWLNLGDSYAGASGSGGATEKQSRNVGSFHDGGVRMAPGLKPKDLVGIPWRVAFALQADGWFLRSDVIWSKPNPMPESVTDRPTKAHEYVFLLSKSARYFFDADAVREAAIYEGVTVKASNPDTAKNGQKGRYGATAFGFTQHDTTVAGRNLRSVWTIATAPYPGAHFATFPPKLVEPCVKAGTSERGVCPECGAPWARVVDTEFVKLANRLPTRKAVQPGADMADVNSHNAMGYNRVTTTGWRPTCDHGGEPVPAVILDIFAGTGTVGMVAQSLSRRAVLIDLNPEYLVQSLGRNHQVPLGLGS
jgi:DNA modification methylase